MQTKILKKYSVGYFSFVGSLFFCANAIVFLNNYMKWLDDNLFVSVLILLYVTVIFTLSAVVFNLFRNKWTRKEGFFFLITSPVKLIISSFLLFFVIRSNIQYKHGIAAIFIGYYFLLLFYDTYYQVRILKENESQC